ncbi:hypothetical protein GRI44_02420 [Altererythrobacter confluentis]|uniref:TnsA endonuclease N-terminal domain-containing protein n=1 Tax=Allopontixanthobacter confluentis TaxID=1849021 RepID=A0A6L7GEZ1_9SPHN|nr:TnsA endonuclease N-terminal domain-containing protein [Allopontixanthobacter confluentis]MXP13608.1 hypothetical protein [Allopontixanthobacter confluentis]
MSDIETRLHAELEWNRAVTRIEAQYLLPLHATERIAAALGIRHPQIPHTREPAPMSTDLYFEMILAGVTTRHARSVKSADAFDIRGRSPRRAAAVRHMSEKLEIERRYWSEAGVHWRLVTDLDLCRVRCANIRLLLSTDKLDPALGPGFWQDAIDLTAAILKAGSDRPLAFLAQRAEETAGLEARHFIACVRHLCTARVLAFDMSVHFSPELRASDFVFTEEG